MNNVLGYTGTDDILFIAQASSDSGHVSTILFIKASYALLYLYTIEEELLAPRQMEKPMKKKYT